MIDMAAEALLYVTNGYIIFKHFMTGLWQTDMMKMHLMVSVLLTELITIWDIPPIIVDG